MGNKVTFVGFRGDTAPLDPPLTGTNIRWIEMLHISISKHEIMICSALQAGDIW